MKFFASNDRSHWESVYQTHKPNQVSWFQPEARLSLELVQSVTPSVRSRIIDVGGGPSTLVDGLLAAGYIDLTVLDLFRHRAGARTPAIRRASVEGAVGRGRCVGRYAPAGVL